MRLPSRRAALLGGLLLLAAGGVAQAQKEFVQQLKLAVDTAGTGSEKVKAQDLRRTEEVLKARLPILVEKGAATAGSVTAASAESIVVRAPGGRLLTDGQIQQFGRVGRLELRHLEDVRTGYDSNGRYTLEAVQVQNRQFYRVRDSRSVRPIPLDEFLEKCPLVADTADLLPGSAKRISGGAYPAVRVELAPKAARRLGDLKTKPGQVVAILLDGEILSMSASGRSLFTPEPRDPRAPRPPKVKETKEQREERKRQEAADEAAQREAARSLTLAGIFPTEEDAAYLAVVLNSGELPLPLKVVSRETTDK